MAGISIFSVSSIPLFDKQGQTGHDMPMNIIRVKATPGAKKFSVQETGPKILKISVREEAEQNEANDAIMQAVADFYSIPRNKLRMISGHKSANKMVRVLE